MRVQPPPVTGALPEAHDPILVPFPQIMQTEGKHDAGSRVAAEGKHLLAPPLLCGNAKHRVRAELADMVLGFRPENLRQSEGTRRCNGPHRNLAARGGFREQGRTVAYHRKILSPLASYAYRWGAREKTRHPRATGYLSRGRLPRRHELNLTIRAKVARAKCNYFMTHRVELRAKAGVTYPGLGMVLARG